MFSLTIVSLALAAMIGIADKVVKLDTYRYGRLSYFVLHLLALVGAGFSAYNQDQLSAAKLAASEEKLRNIESVGLVTNVLVGDLAKLAALGGSSKYYVRIAAATSAEDLTPHLRKIENQFAGARGSGLVAVRETTQPTLKYELVFGQDLNLVAAQVFQRLAMSHHFPPKENVAAIVQEKR